MRKPELVSAVSEACEYPKNHVKVITDALFDTIFEAVSQGESVEIKGFGKFIVSESPERNGRNPQTGETIVIPAHNTVRFKASTTMKQAAR